MPSLELVAPGMTENGRIEGLSPSTLALAARPMDGPGSSHALAHAQSQTPGQAVAGPTTFNATIINNVKDTSSQGKRTDIASSSAGLDHHP